MNFSTEPRSAQEAKKIVRNRIAPSAQKFYVLVKLPANSAQVEYFVVPSEKVLEAAWVEVSKYLGLKDGKITRVGTRSKAPLKYVGNYFWEPDERYRSAMGLLKRSLEDDTTENST